LSGYATTTNLALKANLASPTFTGTVAGITFSMVGLGNVDNTSDANKAISTATQSALDSKVNKETGKGLSTEDYSSAEKTKLAAIEGTNTGDQDLSSFATNSNLDLKANLASPTFTGTVAGINSTMVGLGNVNNTSDISKPISTATQSALDLKVNKETGKGLSTEDYSSAEKTKLAAIEGTNTGDQDLSSFASNANLDLKANNDSPELTGIPLSPTASDGTNSTQIATTAFVVSATTGKWVDLVGEQNINGDKRFSNNILVRGASLGAFGAPDTGNIGYGIANYVYGDTSTMQNNTAIGNFAFTSSSGSNNTAIGTNAIRQGDGGSGDENTAVGTAALTNAQAGNRNTAVGAFTMTLAVGSDNTAIGNLAGSNIRTGGDNTFLGSKSDINSAINGGINNATALGSGAIVTASNTIQLGNSAITDVITVGKITTGAITIPNVDGDAGQVLSTDGSGIVSWSTPSAVSTGNFVNVTDDQNIGGVKNFSNDIKINGIEIGKGVGNGDANLAIGTNLGTGTGYRNTGIGVAALNSFSGTSFGNNTGVGYFSLVGLTTGYGNTSIGAETMFNVGSNDNNSALGNQSLINAQSSENTATGANAGSNVTTGGGNTFIGRAANVSDGTFSNSTAIGREAIATASNTIQLGNGNIINVNTSGTITAGTVSYPNVHNSTSGQVLITNASGLASWENTIQYKQVILSNNTTDQTSVTVGGLSIRVNNKILEISRITNSDPSTIGVFATVYRGIAGAFNAQSDGSGGPVNPKYGTTIANANVGTWSSLLDSANGTTQEIGDYYFKLEADLSVYDNSKTYKLTVLTDGWGKVIMRLIYYPE
jgi:hypothetical protein